MTQSFAALIAGVVLFVICESSLEESMPVAARKSQPTTSNACSHRSHTAIASTTLCNPHSNLRGTALKHGKPQYGPALTGMGVESLKLTRCSSWKRKNWQEFVVHRWDDHNCTQGWTNMHNLLPFEHRRNLIILKCWL